MKRLSLVFMLLTGCVRVNSELVRPGPPPIYSIEVSGPSGKTMKAVYKEAVRVCPYGWDVLDQDGGTTVSNYSTASAQVSCRGNRCKGQASGYDIPISRDHQELMIVCYPHP